MALSAAGMLLAAFGFMSPITGAVAQEFIDLFAVLNAVRVTLPFGALRDFDRALQAQLVKQFVIDITRHRVGHHGRLPGP